MIPFQRAAALTNPLPDGKECGAICIDDRSDRSPKSEPDVSSHHTDITLISQKVHQ